MNIESIKKLCHELRRLFGIHQNAERRAAEALAENLHPLETLRLILEDETLFRKDRTAKMLATKAQFRSSASLQDWDSNFDRGISKAKLKELAQLGFFQSKENLILIGPTGTGKTHLAISLGRRLCQEGMRTQFFSMNLFFEEVLAEKLAGKYLSFIRKLNRTPVLIWDDFGLRNYTHEEANLLIDIVEERYLKGSIIITSQVDPKGWSKLFEDPVIVEALLNRLLHPSKQIVLTGGSYREQLNKKPN